MQIKKILLILIISLQNLSCQTEENCIKNISIERIYDAPLADLIIIDVEMSEEYLDKISDDAHCHINFYIGKEDFFTTHFVVYENESKNYRFKIRTPHFNYKKNFKEEDFYKLIDSSKSLRVELVYDDSGETFTFTKCK